MYSPPNDMKNRCCFITCRIMNRSNLIVLSTMLIVWCFGLRNSVAAQTTEVVISCNTWGTVAIEIESIWFGVTDKITNPNDFKLIKWIRSDTIDGVVGIKITDEVGSCGHTGWLVRDARRSFGNMQWVSHPGNQLNNNGDIGTISPFENGVGRVIFPIRLAQEDLHLISWQMSPHIQVFNYDSGTNFIPTSAMPLARRWYNETDGSSGVYEIVPRIYIKMPPFVPRRQLSSERSRHLYKSMFAKKMFSQYY